MTIKEKLEEQMKNESLREYAIQCRTIADKLEELDGGHIWSNKWEALVKVRCLKLYDSRVFFYMPTDIGEIFLKGLKI